MAWFTSLPLLLAQAADQIQATDAAQQAVQTTVVENGYEGLTKLAVALAVVVGSFVLGALLASAIKLKEYSTELGLILFSIIASAAVLYFGWPPKLGIDLSGGVVLVYEVEQSAVQSGKLQDLADTVSSRLNDGRDEKIVVAVVGDNIELTLPAGTDRGAVENQIGAMRSNGIPLEMESRGTVDGRSVLVYRPDRSFKRVDMDKLVAAVNRRINPGGVKEVTVRQYGPESIEIIIPEVDPAEVDTIKNIISTLGALEFRILANNRKPEHTEVIKRALASPAPEVVETTPEGRRVMAKWVGAGTERGLGGTAVVRTLPNGDEEVLVMIDPYNVTGQYLRRAAPDIDQAGRDSISFSFNAEGAQLFGEFTGKNVPDTATGLEQYLGIVLDDVLMSAATLREQIRDQGQITGSFQKSYVEAVVSVLNAGSLPTALQKVPIQDQQISAQLGADTIAQGARAMAVGSICVLAFMFIYYRFAGLVANSAVILNIVMVLALMILIKAALTLPGLAGLVLTVGMAVDANVLIYERMREELQRGASLRMAIRNGYQRAMSTIIDSNVTSIATGIVLFAIGTDQIKGFAVTLVLGLLVSMYTAVYCSRVVFNIFEKKRWITKLNMMQWFKKTDFDFVRLMKPAAALSSILVLACLIGVVARGKDILDIDFTGGSSVQVQFKQDQPQDLAKVRRAVADLPDVAVSAVGTDNREFKIDTSEDDVDAVTEVLKKAFGDALSTYSMSFDNVRPYVADAASGAAGATDAPSQGAATVQPAAPETADKPVADEVIVEEDMKEETPEDTTPAAETPAEETSAEEPAIDKPAEDAPEAPATVEAPAAEDAPADAPPASDAPADAPPANEQSAVPTTLRGLSPTETVLATLVVGQKAAGDAPADAPAADAASTPVEGTSVDLTFPELVNYATLHDWIVAELKSADLAGTYFNLTGKDFTAGSSARYADWTLNIMLPAEQTTKMLDRIRAKLADEPVFPAANNIGGKVADNTKLSAVYAVLASLVIIVLYVWIRFQNVVFGFAAVLALLHDVMMALGFLALSYWLSNDLGLSVLLIDPFKISLAVVAALLTIVGFSINDTIVIFDRIREIRGKSPELTGAMINRAINETLSRTFITSGTLLIAVLILYIYGGSGIHPFAFTMLIGVISGTYSTVFIAAPILLYLFPHKSTGTSSPAASSKAPMASAGS